jgi:hypothetical protein
VVAWALKVIKNNNAVNINPPKPDFFSVAFILKSIVFLLLYSGLKEKKRVKPIFPGECYS